MAKRAAKAKPEAQKPAKTQPVSKRRAAVKPEGDLAPGEGRLTEEQKIFVVGELACWRKPQEVADALKEQFGVELERQSIERYDPTKYAGRGLKDPLLTLFHDTRRAYREETANIALSGKAERIRRLEDLADKVIAMAQKAEIAGNLAFAEKLVERAQLVFKQIAEEMGDAFTNRRELTGKNGAPLIPPPPDLSALTNEQLDAIERLNSTLVGKPASAR